MNKEKENILDYVDTYRTSILVDLESRMNSGSFTKYDVELYKKIKKFRTEVQTKESSSKTKNLKLAINA